ncbi:MAG: alpha-2-macroglobulin family protein, partial [Armatimonadota bacterium]
IYTDRPIYRPGHTMKFKGIFRQWQTGSYSVRSNAAVTFVITNPEGTDVAKIPATTSAYGTSSGSWDIPEDTNLGNYSVGVIIGDKGTEKFHSASFAVQEYRKPEYSVAVQIPKPYYIRGQKIDASVRANYYFGAPVAGAEVTYTVYRSQWYFWDYADEYESWFDQGEGEYGYDSGGYGDIVKEGRGVTDDNGELKLDIPTDNEDELSRYVIETRVVDPTMREVSASAGTNVVPAEFRVQAEPAKYVYLPGDNIRFDIKAVDWEHRAVTYKPVDVVIETSRWRGTKEVRRQIGIASAKTDAKGKAKLEWRAKDQGALVFTFRSKDSAGREAKTESCVYVGNDSYWSDETTAPNDVMTVIKDKKTYSRGDTARLVLRTKMKDAAVLVTMEGDRLFDARVVQIKGSGYVLDVPLLAEYTPNVTLVCTVIRGGQVHSQETELIISPKTSLLTVKISSSKPRYKPGETASYTIETLNSTGQGVPAEVSLGVVDEAIYALRNDTTPDIQKHYWGPRSKQVSTSSSIDDYYYGGVDKFENKIRKYFPDTAYWNPTLKTDSLGIVHFTFRMPDSLTIWRATARAVTASTQVGSAVQKVIVTKDLIVRLQAPRFFRERDKMEIGLIVHNYTGAQKKVSVRLKVMGIGPGVVNKVESVTVDNNGTAKAVFSIEIKSPGKATLLAEAVTEDRAAADALQVTMPVYAHGSRSRAENSGDASNGAGFVMSIAKDGKKVGSALRIDLTPSSAGAMLQGIDYLAAYPWGCVEQTLSSFVPDVLVQRALKSLNAPIDPEKQSELPKMIKTGVKRLRQMQHPDGSFGWYMETEADLGMTAYAVLGLREAQQAGVVLPPEMLSRSAAWLNGHMQPELPPRPITRDWKTARCTYQGKLEDRAYAVMALGAAGRLKPEVFGQLSSRSDDLTDFALACVGMAAAYTGRAESVAAIADELDLRARHSAGLTFWASSNTDNYWSDQAATAMAMRVLARAGRTAPQLESVAGWLSIHRNGGYWTSTRDTALVILALIEHLERITPFEFTAVVKVNGGKIGTYTVTRADYFKQPRSFIVASKDIRLGSNRITIEKQGQGPLSWTASLSYVTTQEDVPAQSGYFDVTRKYYRVKLMPYTQDGERLYKESLEPVKGQIKTGEVIRVQLTVKPKGSASYVLLDNPLPSGFEILNPEREYNSYYSGLEIHDERVGVFSNTVSYMRTLEFDVRAEVPGELHAMPCEVYSMYKPNLFGRCAEDRLSVR